MICIPTFSICISVFRFLQLTVAVTLGLLQPCGHEYFLIKNTTANHKPAANRKPYSWTPTSPLPLFPVFMLSFSATSPPTVAQFISSFMRLCSINC